MCAMRGKGVEGMGGVRDWECEGCGCGERGLGVGVSGEGGKGGKMRGVG